MSKLFPPFLSGTRAVGLLFLRLTMGTAMVLHSLTKITKPFAWMDRPGQPPSPVPDILQALAALSEFGGGMALILGLLTPIAAFGIMCTMFVAAFSHIQRGDPFVGREGSWESAGLYFVLSLMVILTGPGILSLDALLFGRDHPRVSEERLPQTRVA